MIKSKRKLGLQRLVGLALAGCLIASIGGCSKAKEKDTKESLADNPSAGKVDRECLKLLQRIGQSIILYAAGNDDEYPASLDDLVREQYIGESMLHCPLQGIAWKRDDTFKRKLTRSVFYREPVDSSGGAIMAYCDPQLHFDNDYKVNVLYVGGTVAAVEYDEFKKMIEQDNQERVQAGLKPIAIKTVPKMTDLAFRSAYCRGNNIGQARLCYSLKNVSDNHIKAFAGKIQLRNEVGKICFTDHFQYTSKSGKPIAPGETVHFFMIDYADGSKPLKKTLPRKDWEEEIEEGYTKVQATVAMQAIIYE